MSDTELEKHKQKLIAGKKLIATFIQGGSLKKLLRASPIIEEALREELKWLGPYSVEILQRAAIAHKMLLDVANDAAPLSDPIQWRRTHRQGQAYMALKASRMIGCEVINRAEQITDKHSRGEL